MIVSDKPNPFQVLGLPTSTTNKEIVERGRELYDTAETEEQRLLYRWAKEQLLSNEQIRLEYELFEAPGTQYEDTEWESFARKYKKNPVTPATLLRDAEPVNVQDVDMAALIELLLQDVLTVPEGDIAIAIHNSPFSPTTTFPLEVRDVLFG